MGGRGRSPLRMGLEAHSGGVLPSAGPLQRSEALLGGEGVARRGSSDSGEERPLPPGEARVGRINPEDLPVPALRAFITE